MSHYTDITGTTSRSFVIHLWRIHVPASAQHSKKRGILFWAGGVGLLTQLPEIDAWKYKVFIRKEGVTLVGSSHVGKNSSVSLVKSRQNTITDRGWINEIPSLIFSIANTERFSRDLSKNLKGMISYYLSALDDRGHKTHIPGNVMRHKSTTTYSITTHSTDYCK